MDSMTPAQALKNLETVTAEVPLKRADHLLVAQSIEILRGLVDDAEAP